MYTFIFTNLSKCVNQYCRALEIIKKTFICHSFSFMISFDVIYFLHFASEPLTSAVVTVCYISA